MNNEQTHKFSVALKAVLDILSKVGTLLTSLSHITNEKFL